MKKRKKRDENKCIKCGECARICSKIESINNEKEEAVRCQNFEKAAKVRDEQRKLKEQLEQVRETWNSSNKEKDTVNEEVIADIVSMWTGIPVNKILEEEAEKLKDSEFQKIISKTIVERDRKSTRLNSSHRL